MTTITNENIRPFDIDGCLIVNTATSLKTVLVWDKVEDKHIRVGINEAMVRLLKEEHSRGSYVIAWSRSGYDWARAVILALNLDTYVSLVLSKPTVYFDNEPVQDWMKDRVFIAPNVEYKK